MAINSKDKGRRGERELAKKLKEYGFDCRRGQQYSGIEGEDVVGLDGIHIEVKRVERLNIYDAVDQAKRDSDFEDLPFDWPKLPAVFHRKNHCEWLVTMPLTAWIEIYREWANGGVKWIKIQRSIIENWTWAINRFQIVRHGWI